MNETFCLSTTTSPYTLEVTGLPVTDDLGNAYFATTTCPQFVASTSSSTINIGNPLDLSFFVLAGSVALFVYVCDFIHRLVKSYVV